MLEDFANAVAAQRQEAAHYPDWVRIWMKVMAVSFFAGLPIALWDRRALWIAGMAALTAAGLVLARVLWPEVARLDAGTVLHLVLWPPAAWAVWRGRVASGPFLYWRYWVTLLIMVSLVLDLRNLIQWF